MKITRLKRICSILSVILLLNVSMTVPASAATARERAVIDYLNNWTYTQDGATYFIVAEALSKEELAKFVNADFEDLDAMIMDFIAAEFENCTSMETIYFNVSDPTTFVDSGYVTKEISFTYEDYTQIKTFEYKISANIVSSNGEVTKIGSESCEIRTIPTYDEFYYDSLGHVFSMNFGNHASICFNARFCYMFSEVIGATKWVSMVSNFYV